MNRQDVETHFAYNQWANHRLLEAAGRLTTASFVKDLNASFGSLRGTLSHLLWGEWWWLRFWQDGSLPPEFPPEEFPTVPALAARWATLEEEQQAFVQGLTDEQLAVTRRVRSYEYTLGELIHHLLNHSTYHRGQVVLLLRQLGETPPATDFRLFLTELRYGATY
jgi:uncharacterized damage-inducible protein DinB